MLSGGQTSRCRGPGLPCFHAFRPPGVGASALLLPPAFRGPCGQGQAFRRLSGAFRRPCFQEALLSGSFQEAMLPDFHAYGVHAFRRPGPGTGHL